RLRPGLDMQAVGANPAGNPGVAGNKGGSARRLDDRQQGFAPFLKALFVKSVLRNDHRSDIAAAQGALDNSGELVCIGNIGRYKKQAAAVGEVGHEISYRKRR